MNLPAMMKTTSTIDNKKASILLRLILSLLLPISLRSFEIQPLLHQYPSRLHISLRRIEKRYDSHSKTCSSSSGSRHPFPRTTVQTLLVPQNRHYSSKLPVERRRPFTTTSLQSTIEKPLTTTVARTTNDPSSDDTILSQPTPHSLPPPPPPPENKILPAPRTDVQNEFRSMIDSFSSYTPDDVSLVDNPRYRALFDCVTAVSNEPDVYVAFLILFEDVYPLRVAGRMIYGHLTNVMKEAKSGSSSSDDYDDVVFVDPRLTITKEDDNNKNNHRIFDEKEERHYERFNQMVETFKEWEDGVLHRRERRRQQRRRRREGGGDRMERVLRGCFVGARNPQVVEALRIVYIDFPTLRFAGDLIFKLMSKLMGS